jgi:hypothetical protein
MCSADSTTANTTARKDNRLMMHSPDPTPRVTAVDNENVEPSIPTTCITSNSPSRQNELRAAAPATSSAVDDPLEQLDSGHEFVLFLRRKLCLDGARQPIDSRGASLLEPLAASIRQRE